MALIYAVLRVAWGLLVPKRKADSDGGTGAAGRGRSAHAGRFDTSQMDVSDAEFEDVKESRGT